MNTLLLFVLAIIALMIGFLIWRVVRVKSLLTSWGRNWAPVQFAETPYADILCGLEVQVRKKEGPYTFLKSETLSPDTSTNYARVKVFYKGGGKTREFVANEFPLQPNKAFEVYQTYRYFMDGGPPTLLLVAVPLLAQPMTNREIKKRRETRSDELIKAWVERINTRA